MEYRLSDLFVLYLDAGNDTNGNPRRLYVVGHAPTGDFLVTVDERYAGLGAIREAVGQFQVTGGEPGAASVALQSRTAQRIRIAPSYRTHLLREEKRARAEALLHGKPVLTLD
jgi:hypothetical protein